MDIFSYKLGKNSGGGSSGGIDYSTIGYEGTPQGVIDNYNYSKQIYDNWDNTQTNLTEKFLKDTKLEIMPLVDTSSATNMYGMFSGCTDLQDVPLLDTSNVTSMRSMFENCYKLKKVPLFDTSNVTTMRSFLSTSSAVDVETDIPVFNVTSLDNSSSLRGFIQNDKKLTDNGLNNLLIMCSRMPNYGTKTFAHLLNSSTSKNYPTSRIQSMPAYQDFINAGWTIGY